LRYLSKTRLEKGAIKEEKQRRPSLPGSLIDRYQFAKSEFSIVALKTSSTRSPRYQKFVDLPPPSPPCKLIRCLVCKKLVFWLYSPAFEDGFVINNLKEIRVISCEQKF